MKTEAFESNFQAASLLCETAEERILAELATTAAETAQQHARRDTSFYADNIIALGAGTSLAGNREQRMSPREGRTVERYAPPVPAIPPNTAAVAAAADYAYFLEREDDTIANAVEATKEPFEAIVGRISAELDMS